MKKNFLLTMLAGAAVLFASCQKADEPGQDNPTAARFTVSAEGAMATRATVNDLSRYVMEIYESATPTGAAVLHIEQATGMFDVLLKEGVTYTFLFWADFGTPDVNDAGDYEASDLKAAKIRQQPTAAAWAGKVSFTKGKESENDYKVMLTHAVAQVNFIQSEDFTQDANTLAVEFPQTYSLNAADGTATEILNAGASVKATYTFTTTTKAQANKTIGTSYLIAKSVAAPTDAKTVLNLATDLNTGETQHAIDNVPFARNYRTNIRGAYSNLYACAATVTCDDQWDTETTVTFPQVGWYYFSDKTYSSKLIAGKTPIGIIFWIDPADPSKGKIVGLDEPEANWNGGTNEAGRLAWSSSFSATNATDELDGLKNMAVVKTIDNTFSAYPAFAWVDSKNPANTDYSTATTGIWYLPATKELRQLFAAMSGLKWVASGANAANGEIDDWGAKAAMPNYTNYATARADFNALLTDAGKTAMASIDYWTSTESDYSTICRAVSLTTGYSNSTTYTKIFKNAVRCVRAF